MTLGILALPRSLEPSELQCEYVFIGELLSDSHLSWRRNFEISLNHAYLEFRGLPYLQIYLRIERSIGTKIFVLAVAITNCEWVTFVIAAFLIVLY